MAFCSVTASKVVACSSPPQTSRRSTSFRVSAGLQAFAAQPRGITRQKLPVTAALGKGKDDDKKFITREEEPDQFWQTKTEKKGQNPAKDPLAIIGIIGLLLPFVILGLAIATGVVDVNAGRL